MDNLLEYIIPVIFAAIYFFGNMLSKDSDEGAPSDKRPASAEDADDLERQRRIQAEVRRKIMERRQQVEGGRPRPPVSESARSQDPEPRVSGPTSRIPDPASRIPHRESRIPYPESTSYEDQMQVQLQQIEATKQKAEKLKQQARSVSQKSAAPVRSSSSRTARRPIRSTLRNPRAARAAFIYGEVIGPPVSQRKSQTVPGLS